MLALKSHFRLVRSIHHHYSGRERGGMGSFSELQGGTGRGTAWQPDGYWDRKREITHLLLLLLWLPPHSFHFPFFSSLLKNHPVHMVRHGESPIHRCSVGWVITGHEKGYNWKKQVCSNYRVTDTRWWTPWHPTLNHRIRNICADEGLRRDNQLHTH